jgi:hypothetical protein
VRPELPSIALGVALSVGLLVAGHPAPVRAESHEIQFLFTSDPHYGVTRPGFRGASDVDAHVVNAALVAAMNRLPDDRFPRDGGLKDRQPVGPVDFVVEGGDIANREEGDGPMAIERASDSWAQFRADYVDGLSLTDASGRKAPLFIVPGNHDVSNAIGFYLPMTPAVDKTAMVEIYNRMMRPEAPRNEATFEYPRDKVLTSRDICGIHFMFITIWPDSDVRAWMARDLTSVPASTPVFVFAHDQPDCQSKHFRNPNGSHDINATDRFENLLADELADGTTTAVAPVTEQRALEQFLAAHANITAYFHGNSNWNQFYDWTGPDHTALLHTFRVDSPMKGTLSATDETKLSFQIATIDLESRTMTVRECLWNAHPEAELAPMTWGASTTVALQPRRPMAAAAPGVR